MISLSDLSISQLRNAIWHLNNGRCPGNGIYQSKDKLRAELYERTGEVLGYHEEAYQNSDGKCECDKCELAFKCIYKDKYQRHADTLGLCPKLKK